jgi:hypothetical protein
VKEVIQFDRQISEEERRNIETYIRLKYDINLKQSSENFLTDEHGKLLWDPVENSSYSHGMMSLVKNTQWELDRKSVDENLDDESVLTLGVDSNQPGSVYIIAGHNGKSMQKIVSAHPAFAQQLQRTWKIENIGEAEKLSISYELPSSFSGDANDVALVIGDDSDFSDDRIYLPSLVEDKHIEFPNIQLDEEAYFTFLFNKKIDDVSVYTSFQHVNSVDTTAVIGPGGVNTGLALWLRADTGIELEDDHVVKWLDQSGKGNDLTADLPYSYGTAPQYVQNELNYYPTIRFNHDRLTDYLGRSKFDLTADNKNFTQFIVYRHPQTEKFGGIISYASKLDTNDFLLFNPAELWLFKNGKEQRLNKNSADGRAHIVGIRSNELVGTTDMYLDGSGNLFKFGTSGHEPGGPYVIGQDQDQIGGGFDPEQAFTGDISEVILFQDALSDIDLLKVQTYLAFKYGITLPTMYADQTEKLVWDDAKNARYNHNIFGLGQDNASGIVQKISRSQDDSLITIKNPKDMQVGDFIMLGDNNDKVELKDAQISRTWMAQSKGDVGSMDISFDLSKIQGIDIKKQNSVILAVSSDETFVQSKVFTELHKDGYIVTFKNVTLLDGQFMTLKVY